MTMTKMKAADYCNCNGVGPIKTELAQTLFSICF